MSEDRWGMCAAFGCPLAGSMGSEGKWYCFCHHGRPISANDRITFALQENDFICQTTLDLRGARGSKEWPQVYRNMQQRLIRGGREDLLLGPEDCSSDKAGVYNLTMWLMRLERALIDACELKPMNRPTETIPTASVVGPTHAMEHYAETERPEFTGDQ